MRALLSLRTLSTTVVAASLLFCSVTSAAVFDDFTDPAAFTTFNSYNNSVNGAVPPVFSHGPVNTGMANVGLTRFSTLTVHGAPAAPPSLSADIDIGAGFFALTTSPAVLADAVLQYSGGSVDLSSVGSFDIDVFFIDQDAPFSLTLDDGVNSGTASILVPGGTVGPVSISLNDPGFLGVDLSAVTTLTFEFGSATTPASLDFILTGITTSIVPEPASLALWTLLGLSTVGGAAWRRKKRAGK